jgi:hypothetical protein
MGISLDPVGNIYVTGSTESADFPVQGAFQPSIGGGCDAFVAEFGLSGSLFLGYSTFLGGSSYDRGHGITVDAAQSSYVTGETCSEDFPLEAPFQPGVLDSQSAFLASFDSFGTFIETAETSGLSMSSGPSPFRSLLDITLRTGEAGWIEIDVFDACGRIVSRIYSGAVLSGTHCFSWNADPFPSGLYMLRVLTGSGEALSQKVLLLR